jgi:hypothetical protein
LRVEVAVDKCEGGKCLHFEYIFNMKALWGINGPA